MKLNTAQVEQTPTQFEAQVIPDDHPVVPKFPSTGVTRLHRYYFPVRLPPQPPP